MSFTPPPPPRTVPRTPATMLFLRLFLFVSLHKVAFGDLTINTPQGLINFSNDVSSGSGYSGTTVYLGADLDLDSSLSQQFQPIGNSSSYSFKGTFNGQGHIIKNLNISSSSGYVGLFGYSDGASIRNVILDESCSFSSFCSKSSSDVGSVAGYCRSTVIENVVNMASVIFTGNTGSLRIAGIAARLLFSSTARNCVNYGPVTYSGTTSSSYSEIDIGGIAGLCGGTSTNSIQNCANYGTLTHNGASSYNLYVGGITGINYAGTNIFENCVSAGKVISTTQGSTNNYIGGVVGYISSGTTIAHCLWTSDVGCDKVYGYNKTSVTMTNSNLAALDATTMDDLNEYAEENSLDKWFMLHLNGGTINSLTQDTLIVTQKHFPDPVKEGSVFSFWCMDAKCDGIYDPDTTDITAITKLYAQYTQNKYTVTFEFGNGTTETKKVFYDEKYGTLPDAAERAGWTFIGWFTGVDGSGDEITSETTVSIADDHDLYAQWTINNYTLTFIFNNGESDVVRTLNYNDPIDYPNDPVREGYSFDGWSSKPDTMPAHNLNITAQWTKITEYVEIVFDKKDLSEDDVKIIISKYTNGDDNFVIEDIETVNGETKVIIKFNDAGKAQNFIEIITAASDAKNNHIKKVNFIQNEGDSYSVSLFPNLFNWLLI